MNRIGPRPAKPERGAANGWRAWEGVPCRHWPGHASLASPARMEGWPPGHVPAEAELRAIARHGRGGTA